MRPNLRSKSLLKIAICEFRSAVLDAVQKAQLTVLLALILTSHQFSTNSSDAVGMLLLNSLKIALNSIYANKLRAFMTMLGIIIGIGSVITVIAVGAGGQSLIVNQIQSVGSNLIGILPGASEEDGPPASALGILVTTLTYDDLQALLNRSNVAHLTAGAAYMRGIATATWQNRVIDTGFTGITSGYIDVESVVIEQGRFILPEENTVARVAVLGSEIKNDLLVILMLWGKIKINREILRWLVFLNHAEFLVFRIRIRKYIFRLQRRNDFFLGWSM